MSSSTIFLLASSLLAVAFAGEEEATRIRISSDEDYLNLIDLIDLIDQSPTKQESPNIIFILQDDVGFGDLACYGHPYAQTPNLDKLAREGTMFRNFHVSGITCNPSRTGFMTSRHPASFPNYPATFGFQGVPTITELLQKAGYRTAHIGKWHIGPKSTEMNGTYGIDHVQVIGGRFDDPRGKDVKIYDAAIRYLKYHHKRHGSDKPLYMNVWGRAAHMDVKPASNLVKKFSNVIVDRGKFMGKFMKQKFARRGDKVNSMMRKYLAEIWAMDNLIGKLLNTLDELGMAENTIIIFSADQGPSSGAMGYSGGFRGEKLMQWEGGTRVPFIVRWPGQVPADQVNCHSAISALDFLPTLASIVGIPIDSDRFEGEDVKDIWMGSSRSRARSRRSPIFYKVSSNNPTTKRAMLYGKWKMHWSNKEGRDPELYDLNANYDENKNVYNANRDIGEALLERLIEWDESLPSRYSLKMGNQMKSFNPNKGDYYPTIIGRPKIKLKEAGVNNPPLHEKRCLSESEVE